jgi:hypothetical protein
MSPEAGVAGLVAGVLTIFDLDRTFYFPSKINERFRLWAWYWFFVAANGALAASLYVVAKDIDAIKSLNNWVGAVVVGCSYLAIVRTKFTTFEVGGKTVPFGLEALYEAAKAFVYKRINRIAKKARREETLELAGQKTLSDLGQQAKLAIDQDALMTVEEKRACKEWLLKVLQEGQGHPADDAEQRNAIADFILSGRHVS